MRILPAFVIPAVTLTALSGCAFLPGGPTVSESRDIEGATSLVLNTGGDVSIREGEPSLVITAPQSVLDRLTATVDGGALVLDVIPGTPNFLLGRITYELTLPSLDGLEINGSGDIDSEVPTGSTLAIAIAGSGDVDLRGVDAGEVDLEIVGSGDVELAGTTESLEISISGSGDVTTVELAAARVTVDIDGAGDVSVAASDALDVSISGSGDVTYTGRPEVTQSIAGAGSVERR